MRLVVLIALLCALSGSLLVSGLAHACDTPVLDASAQAQIQCADHPAHASGFDCSGDSGAMESESESETEAESESESDDLDPADLSRVRLPLMSRGGAAHLCDGLLAGERNGAGRDFERPPRV